LEVFSFLRFAENELGYDEGESANMWELWSRDGRRSRVFGNRVVKVKVSMRDHAGAEDERTQSGVFDDMDPTTWDVEARPQRDARDSARVRSLSRSRGRGSRDDRRIGGLGRSRSPARGRSLGGAGGRSSIAPRASPGAARVCSVCSIRGCRLHENLAAALSPASSRHSEVLSPGVGEASARSRTPLGSQLVPGSRRGRSDGLGASPSATSASPRSDQALPTAPPPPSAKAPSASAAAPEPPKSDQNWIKAKGTLADKPSIAASEFGKTLQSVKKCIAELEADKHYGERHLGKITTLEIPAQVAMMDEGMSHMKEVQTRVSKAKTDPLLRYGFTSMANAWAR
jgi:hypothetical protein